MSHSHQRNAKPQSLPVHDKPQEIAFPHRADPATGGTQYCVDPGARVRATSPILWNAGLQALQRATGLTLGDVRRPLLLAVRSGAPVSMPGMMETILNIGLCDATVGGLLRQTGNPRLASVTIPTWS